MRIIRWERVLEWNETWALAVVFGLGQFPIRAGDSLGFNLDFDPATVFASLGDIGTTARLLKHIDLVVTIRRRIDLVPTRLCEKGNVDILLLRSFRTRFILGGDSQRVLSRVRNTTVVKPNLHDLAVSDCFPGFAVDVQSELVVETVVINPLRDGPLAGREGDSLLVLALLAGVVLLPLALATPCPSVNKVL